MIHWWMLTLKAVPSVPARCCCFQQHGFDYSSFYISFPCCLSIGLVHVGFRFFQKQYMFTLLTLVCWTIKQFLAVSICLAGNTGCPLALAHSQKTHQWIITKSYYITWKGQILSARWNHSAGVQRQCACTRCSVKGKESKRSKGSDKCKAVTLNATF